MPPSVLRCFGLTVLLSIGTLACRRSAPPTTGTDPAPSPPSAPAPAPADKSPLTQAELPTTDASIALGNMQGQMDVLQKGLAQNPRDRSIAGQLVGGYLLRARVLGRLADYDQAERLCERMIREAPADPDALLARATVRAALHQFQGALADLDRARRRGQDARMEAARASIQQAIGRYDEALTFRRTMVSLHKTAENLAAEASVRADRGEIAQAERLFVEAQHYHRDVSPFTLSALYLQQGLMWQREGRLARAKELFQAAYERLPAYAPAVSHLAAVEAMTGARPRAIQLVRELVEHSDDPEYVGQLAELLSEAGQKQEAAALTARAQQRYQELLARHPEAFAEPAARFWLAAGDDASKALSWAQRNLEARPTAEAHELVVQAALRAQKPALACSVAERALAVPALRRPRLLLAGSRALAACGQRARAAEMARLAEGR